MDAIVEAALRKWPNVPHCYGWLALDARGDWYMRDERIQAAGPFPKVKGSQIRHEKLLGFIHRNYALDERGAAFFQNGPQRVYVELEATPWIWRVQTLAGEARVTSHTGLPARVHSSWLDSEGRLYLATDLGFGLVHSMDMLDAAAAVEAAGTADELVERHAGLLTEPPKAPDKAPENEPENARHKERHKERHTPAPGMSPWQPQACMANGLPQRFGFQRHPVPAALG